jgi:hypothetical protein
MGDVERDTCFRASRCVFGGEERDIQLVVIGEGGGKIKEKERVSRDLKFITSNR